VTSHVVISGFCTIGAYSFIGVNATFADKVRVGADNFIGMGGVVVKNTDDNGFYVGDPAQIRKVPAKRYCGIRD
jgi:acetyltransferase-like isoleucine patch superfamily enzyme